MDAPNRWGDLPLASWAKGAKGLKSPPRAPTLPDPAAKREAPETSYSPQLLNICSAWPSRKNISSKGQIHFFFFFFTYRSARCHGVWKIKLGGGFGGVIVGGKKNLLGRLFSWKYLG